MVHWLSTVTCDVSQCMVGDEDLKSWADSVFYVCIHGIPCLGLKSLRTTQFTLAHNVHRDLYPQGSS